MGERVPADSGLTFQVRLPMRTHVRLLKDGKVIKEHWDRKSSPTSPKSRFIAQSLYRLPRQASRLDLSAINLRALTNFIPLVLGRSYEEWQPNRNGSWYNP